MNLEDKLTVFLVSVGSPSRWHALEALKKQNCTFRLQLVENMYPMSHAFQYMLDQCTTPYYVQVDEDMVLYPNAIRKMYLEMSQSNPDVMMIVFPLWDSHLARPIIGVKIFRTEIARKFPFRNVRACEIDQLERAKAAGYRYINHYNETITKDQTLGTHGEFMTAMEAFERYKDLFVRYRKFKFMRWIQPYANRIFCRYVEEGNPVDLAASLGAIVGLTMPLEWARSEKDARLYGGEDYKMLRQLIPGKGPITLDLHITSRCNRRCWFCQRGEDVPDMSPSLVRQVLNMYPSIRYACMSGLGEPLLSPQFFAIADVLQENRITKSLITNGELVPIHIKELTKRTWLYINISLNAADEEEFESVTPIGSFQRAIEGIAALVESPLREKVSLSFVIHKENLRRIPNYIQLADSLNVPAVMLHSLLPKPHFDRSMEEKILTVEDLEYIEMLQKQTWPVKVLFWPRIAGVGRRGMCDSPWTHISVNGGGRSGLCNRIIPPYQDLGADPWMSELAVELRKSVLTEDGKWSDICSRCWANWSG